VSDRPAPCCGSPVSCTQQCTTRDRHHLERSYGALRDVLDRAFDQAANGKGSQRHANGLPFEQQPMQTISNALGTHAGLLFQAAKKAQESQRLPHDAAVRELLGAINYLAGAIIWLESHRGNSEA